MTGAVLAPPAPATRAASSPHPTATSSRIASPRPPEATTRAHPSAAAPGSCSSPRSRRSRACPAIRMNKMKRRVTGRFPPSSVAHRALGFLPMSTSPNGGGREGADLAFRRACAQAVSSPSIPPQSPPFAEMLTGEDVAASRQVSLSPFGLPGISPAEAWGSDAVAASLRLAATARPGGGLELFGRSRSEGPLPPSARIRTRMEPPLGTFETSCIPTLPIVRNRTRIELRPAGEKP